MVAITEREDMPSQFTVYKWLNKFPDFAERYAQARVRQAHTLADRAADMILRGCGDPVTARVKLDAIKWITSKLAPKVYGDQLNVEHSGSVIVQPVDYSNAELEEGPKLKLLELEPTEYEEQ